MKIALVQDGLMCRAGGEQVALCFHKAFPQAPIYTQCYRPSLTFSEFKDCDIRPSWLQKFVRTDNQMKALFFPLGILAMKSHDLSQYDVVLMSSTHCAKYVKVADNALVINYCHTPFRLAWNPESYAQYQESTGLKRKVFDFVLNIIRRIDFAYAQRPNYFLANTEETAERARKNYGAYNPVVMYPPVNCRKFYVGKVKDYFLVVSRLEYYKKVDLVVDAFNQLGYPLIIVGKGIQANEIKAAAKSNITFLSGLSADELADVYAGCRAFIFPQHEDYGITPLEANAAGRPVIAYGAGGVLYTQIPVASEPARATALFFDHQTTTDLINAIKEFEAVENAFNPAFIRNHAEAYDEDLFIKKIKSFVTEKFSQHIEQKVVRGNRGEAISISGNSVTNCGDVGIDFESSRSSNATNNVVRNCKNYALAVFFASKGILFTKNRVYQDTNFGHGVGLTGEGQSTDITFSGNIVSVKGANKCGLVTDGSNIATNVTIEKSTFVTMGNEGIPIRILDNNGFNITNNLNIRGVSAVGISLEGSSNSVIAGNKVFHIGKDATAFGVKGGIFVYYRSNNYPAKNNIVKNNMVSGYKTGINDDCWGDVNSNNIFENNITPNLAHRTANGIWGGKSMNNTAIDRSASVVTSVK